MTGGDIPIVEVHRGVGIHDQQPRERIERLVKPAIDQISGVIDPGALLGYCRNPRHPPEARIFAAARIEAIFQIAVDERRERPDIDLDLVRACVAGLESQTWRSPWNYGTIAESDAVEREVPITDEYFLAQRK